MGGAGYGCGGETVGGGVPVRLARQRRRDAEAKLIMKTSWGCWMMFDCPMSRKQRLKAMRRWRNLMNELFAATS